LYLLIWRLVMGHQVIQTNLAPAAIGPYSQAIKVGPWLFVSGQIALQPDTGELVSENFAKQTEQVLKNLRHILEAAGYELSDVVSTDVFMTDIGQFSSFNRIYEEFFLHHKPARAVVEVKGLPRGTQVEIKCIAYRGP
jgi:2-iminobutanoate/2-iminopropanoate deaminase